MEFSFSLANQQMRLALSHIAAHRHVWLPSAATISVPHQNTTCTQEIAETTQIKPPDVKTGPFGHKIMQFVQVLVYCLCGTLMVVAAEGSETCR
jgi:hypothetical protein